MYEGFYNSTNHPYEIETQLNSDYNARKVTKFKPSLWVFYSIGLAKKRIEKHQVEDLICQVYYFLWPPMGVHLKVNDQVDELECV